MSPLQQKPILHGRDHCPGGADPIPCMISGPSGDFEGVLLATGPYAYWRLGETGTPWADTSGFAPAADLAEEDSGTALTPDVPGALASGDDGAVEFNYDGIASSGGRLLRNNGVSKTFSDAIVLAEMSVGVWAKVKASALTRRGLIIGNSEIAGSGEKQGWGLQVIYPARTVRFTRGENGGGELYAETSGGVVADEWNFFVGTYDGATIRLYVNGELVDSTADAARGSSTTPDIRVGFSYVDYAAFSAIRGWFYGTADEAAVWNWALSQTEINNLYAAGASGAGVGEEVLLSDGAGGTYWGQVTTAAIEDGTIVDADVATGADIDPLKIEHPGGTTTFLRADGTWASTGGGDPASDTLVWMPLADSDGILVLDADDAVIPTLIPI